MGRHVYLFFRYNIHIHTQIICIYVKIHTHKYIYIHHTLNNNNTGLPPGVTDGELLAKFKACDPLDAFVPPRQARRRIGMLCHHNYFIYYILWVCMCVHSSLNKALYIPIPQPHQTPTPKLHSRPRPATAHHAPPNTKYIYIYPSPLSPPNTQTQNQPPLTPQKNSRPRPATASLPCATRGTTSRRPSRWTRPTTTTRACAFFLLCVYYST